MKEKSLHVVKNARGIKIWLFFYTFGKFHNEDTSMPDCNVDVCCIFFLRNTGLMGTEPNQIRIASFKSSV